MSEVRQTLHLVGGKRPKPIRLIELFSGVGAQASALERLGVEFEHWKTSEWEVNAISSYNEIHIKDHTDYSKELDATQLASYLNTVGVSTDGKKPMTYAQIERKGEAWMRNTYDNYIATHNIGSVVNAHGDDLEIRDTDKFTYLLTYLLIPLSRSICSRKTGRNG